MEFGLTETQRELRDAARKFATGELGDIARAIEDEDEPLALEMRRRYGQLGFLGVNLPTEFGGLGLGSLEAVLVLEEFAKISIAVAFPVFESCVGPLKVIEHFGQDRLKQEVLPKVTTGDVVVAVSMSEPDAGTALTDLTTKARLVGDTITLNGQKRWCSGGGHAEAYVVYCRLSDDPGAKGIGAVYVERDRDGVSFGAPEKLMGWRGVPSADIFFDNVELPAHHLIVPAGGFGKLMEAFDLERCGNAVMSLALAQAALDQALAYVQERKQFGKPIIDFQAVQLQLAEMAMKVEASRLLIYRALQNAEDGLPSILDSSMAKCFANQITREVCGAGLQLMGGYGYAKEYGMEQRFRDAWGWGIAGGAIDVQKVNIASALVGRRFNQRAGAESK